MLRGSKLPQFYNWDDPSSPGRQNNALRDELQALWNVLDERAGAVVVPGPVLRGLHPPDNYQSGFGEHVMVSSFANPFVVRLPWITLQDGGRFVDVSRDRVESVVMVVASTQDPREQFRYPVQLINGGSYYVFPSTLSPLRFRAVGSGWRV
jgi:hypothetical protein